MLCGNRIAVLDLAGIALPPRDAASSAATGGFQPPTIDDFFPPGVLFQGTPFELNRVMLIRLLAVGVLVLWMIVSTRRLKIVPGRGQVVTELLFGFVRNNIAYEALGEEDGRRYLPLIATMFFLPLAVNVTSVIPVLGIAGSSVIGLPIVMAVVSWVAFIYAGFRAQGWRYLRNALFIPGVPWPLYILLTPLEILSTFIVRPVTLVMRLLMNMVAGHLLLALVYSASSFFLFVLLPHGNFAGLLGVGTAAFGVVYMGFELFTDVLQAYVFAFLTAIYIQLAVADDHG